jgi:hypothetical protein
MKKKNDGIYDSINAAYELSKLESKINKSINSTNDLRA